MSMLIQKIHDLIIETYQETGLHPIRDWFLSRRATCGCPIGVLALRFCGARREIDVRRDAVAKAVANIIDEPVDHIRDVFQNLPAGFDGKNPPDEISEDNARVRDGFLLGQELHKELME